MVSGAARHNMLTPSQALLTAQDSSELLRLGRVFEETLKRAKAAVAPADYGWYPYDSLAGLAVVADLIAPQYSEIAASLAARPVADLGCGDGDLAMLFATAGLEVDALDHLETNFNQMRGVALLKETLGLPVQIHDIDLNAGFELPRRDYGLTLFLGTLYHLKNPFYVLETLARHSDWCILSTRVARLTPEGVPMAAAPVAYLLSGRESNNDSTNFWTFSPFGLSRIVERAGWIKVGEKGIGCAEDSDPVRPEADERLFLLLKSRTRFPELQVWPLEGWHGPEQDGWRWTAKRFLLGVSLPRTARTVEFALRFNVPDVVIESSRPITITCLIEGRAAGSITCDKPGTLEFRGRFPEGTVGRDAALTLEFLVRSSFVAAADQRELGVIIPVGESSATGSHRIPFRIS